MTYSARWLGRAALECAGLGSAVMIAGCAAPEHAFFGVDSSSGLEIVLRPMPQGRSFSGRFRSPHLGELTLEQRGSVLTGRYRYEADGRRVVGTLDGSVRANVATVRWREHPVGAAASSGVAGLGFFLYDAGAADGACATEPRPARLFGRRQVATRIFPTPPDEQYSWLNVSQRNEPWTAVEILPGERKP